MSDFHEITMVCLGGSGVTQKLVKLPRVPVIGDAIEIYDLTERKAYMVLGVTFRIKPSRLNANNAGFNVFVYVKPN